MADGLHLVTRVLLLSNFFSIIDAAQRSPESCNAGEIFRRGGHQRADL